MKVMLEAWPGDVVEVAIGDVLRIGGGGRPMGSSECRREEEERQQVALQPT